MGAGLGVSQGRGVLSGYGPYELGERSRGRRTDRRSKCRNDTKTFQEAAAFVLRAGTTLQRERADRQLHAMTQTPEINRVCNAFIQTRRLVDIQPARSLPAVTNQVMSGFIIIIIIMTFLLRTENCRRVSLTAVVFC